MEEPAEVTQMREEIQNDPRGFLHKMNLNRWREQANFHFGPAEKVEVDAVKQPTKYELQVLSGLQGKPMFAGLYAGPTKKLVTKGQRRKKNKLARASRKRNRKP